MTIAISELRELNDAIAFSAVTNLEDLKAFGVVVKSRTLLRQLVSAEVHARLVGKVGMALTKEFASHVAGDVSHQEPPSELATLVSRSDTQSITAIMEHLRTMSELRVSSDLAEFRALAKVLLQNLPDLVPGAQMLKALSILWECRYDLEDG